MEDTIFISAKDLTPDYLEHHGVLGMKWGVCRYQNKDGSLTPEGQKRYGSDGVNNNPLTIVKDNLSYDSHFYSDLGSRIISGIKDNFEYSQQFYQDLGQDAIDTIKANTDLVDYVKEDANDKIYDIGWAMKNSDQLIGGTSALGLGTELVGTLITSPYEVKETERWKDMVEQNTGHRPTDTEAYLAQLHGADLFKQAVARQLQK